MSDETTDLQRWGGAWRRQAASVAAETLRNAVMRDTRSLRLQLIMPVCVTLGIGGMVTWDAVRAAS